MSAGSLVRKVCTLVFVAAIGLAATVPAVSEELWFGPQDNLPRPGRRVSEDFPQLFSQPAEWRNAASHIRVFDIPAFYVLRAPEADLGAALGFLASHHIALNVSLLALPAENCGRGVEGILPNVKQTTSAAYRLKQLNANVYSFGLDEPVQYGYLYRGHDACNFPINEIANRVALTIRQVRALYPNAKFIDYEVPQDLPDLRGMLNHWLSAYEQATGAPLDGFTIDANYRHPWQEAARQTIDILHARRIRAGIFLNAPGGANVTDESWMREAKANILSVLAARLPLDYSVITTWVGHPSHNLPETDPLTLTSLVDWYVEHRALGR